MHNCTNRHFINICYKGFKEEKIKSADILVQRNKKSNSGLFQVQKYYDFLILKNSSVKEFL